MRFVWLIIASLLFLQSFAFAETNSSSSAEPPPGAPDVSSVIFSHAVFSNGSIVQNMPLVILARGYNSDTIYRTITDQSGLAILSLQNGSYEIDALLDLPSTQGMDFASTTSLNVPSGGNATLIFYPAGSLAGKVLSDGAPVPDARVSVSCPSSAFDYGRINGGTTAKADEAGGFLFPALPVGTCMVSASTEDLAGSSEAQVAHGQASSASIEIRKKAVAQDNSALLIAGALAVAILLSIVFFTAKKLRASAPEIAASRQKNIKQSESSPEKSAKKSAQTDAEGENGFDANSPRARAILLTLSEREREIVKFLFKSNGKAKRSQMQHKLLIPKTSLLRNLRSLQRKNIVKLTPFGRNLLAELEQSLFN